MVFNVDKIKKKQAKKKNNQVPKTIKNMVKSTTIAGFTSFADEIALVLPQEALVDFCKNWKIDEFYLFGSILRKDFNANSDVDVMLQFSPDAKWGFEIVEMKQELEKIFKRKVDLLTKKSIEQSNNWIRKKEILGTAKLIYVKR